MTEYSPECPGCRALRKAGIAPLPYVDARTLPDRVTYGGSDGQRHFAHIIERHPDGSATIDRGYYGRSRSHFSVGDDPRPYHGGRY